MPLCPSSTGLSPSAAEEFVYEAGAEARCGFADLPGEQRAALAAVFLRHMDDIRQGHFAPQIVSLAGGPQEGEGPWE